jgi:hypothetical protein
MRNTIKEELTAYILDLVNDGILTMENKDEWHFHAFNEDYYMIGYYQCGEWLKRHGMGEFEAADICVQYEKDNFGEVGKAYDNSETVVNMLVFIYGEELIYSMEDEIEDAILELTE